MTPAQYVSNNIRSIHSREVLTKCINTINNMIARIGNTAARYGLTYCLYQKEKELNDVITEREYNEDTDD